MQGLELRRVLVLGILVGLWVGLPAFAADRDLGPDVDALIGKQVKAGGPGMAVAVVDRGKVAFLKGYGLANIEKNIAITTRTTFELASVSKQFTAMAVMILHDQGKLAFDDDVRTYLPELPVYDEKHTIRLRDLLQHTSGLPEYFDFANVKGQDPTFLGNNDYLPLFAKRKNKVPLQFSPGQKYEYTNTNYLLLASVVERVSGKTFGAFLHDEVFQPLGMKDSVVFENPKVKRHDPATGYRKAKKGFEVDIDENLLTVGDGAIWCSVDDMTRWDAGLAEGKLVKAKTMAQALNPSKTRDGKTNDYGFGWGLEFDNKGKLTTMSHNGAWTGYHTEIERDLIEQRTVIVLGNSSSFKVGQTAAAILELFRSRPR